MKYIIIILLIILIIFLSNKHSVEYKKEKLTETKKEDKLICDYNCGKYKTDFDCLGCKNCGICTTVRVDQETGQQKITRRCLPGDKNGSLFEAQCTGNKWTYQDYSVPPPAPQVQVITSAPPTQIITPDTSYDDILLSIGQIIKTPKSPTSPTSPTSSTSSTSNSGTKLTTTVVGESKLIATQLGTAPAPASILLKGAEYNETLKQLDALTKLLI